GDRVPGMAGVLRLPHTAADGAEIKGVGLAGVAGHGETASAAHGAHVAPAQTRQQTGRILTRGAHLLGEDRQAQPGQQAQRGEKDKPTASTYHGGCSYPAWHDASRKMTLPLEEGKSKLGWRELPAPAVHFASRNRSSVPAEMRILPSPATATSDPPREQDWEPGGIIHTAGVRPFRRGYAAISSAPKARCVGGGFRSGDGIGAIVPRRRVGFCGGGTESIPG